MTMGPPANIVLLGSEATSQIEAIAAGTEISFKGEVKETTFTTWNVVGRLNGTGPKADEAVLRAQTQVDTATANSIQDINKKRDYQLALSDVEKSRVALRDVDPCAVGTAEDVRAQVAGDPAFVKSVAPNGWTPLHAAAFADNAATAAILLAAGADVNARAKNKFDNTPLQVAMLSRSSEVAKVLLANGAEVDARMSEGATALHEAAQNGDAVSVRMLLDAGADPSLKMPNGKTAVDLARAAKHREAARILQSASAKKR